MLDVLGRAFVFGTGGGVLLVLLVLVLIIGSSFELAIEPLANNPTNELDCLICGLELELELELAPFPPAPTRSRREANLSSLRSLRPAVSAVNRCTYSGRVIDDNADNAMFFKKRRVYMSRMLMWYASVLVGCVRSRPRLYDAPLYMT